MNKCTPKGNQKTPTINQKQGPRTNGTNPPLNWYGGHLAPKKHLQFKDNSSADNPFKEKSNSDRRTATHVNTLWAPSGHVRLYWAQGSPGPSSQQQASFRFSFTPGVFCLHMNIRKTISLSLSLSLCVSLSLSLSLSLFIYIYIYIWAPFFVC